MNTLRPFELGKGVGVFTRIWSPITMTRYGLMLFVSLLGAYDVLFGYVQCARLTPSKVGLPWLSPSPPSSQLTFPTIPPIAAPSLPTPLTLPTLPGLPNGITLTFMNMSQDFNPIGGVKVTWDTKIIVEISLKLLADAITTPINLIISQFKGGSSDWSISNSAIANNNQQGFNVGATCMSRGQNGFPTKALVIAHSPIDAMNTAVTWFTMLFDGWTLEKPFIASIDVTPDSYGAFLTNTSTMPSLNTFCTHPTWLTSIARNKGNLYLRSARSSG